MSSFILDALIAAKLKTKMIVNLGMFHSLIDISLEWVSFRLSHLSVMGAHGP